MKRLKKVFFIVMCIVIGICLISAVGFVVMNKMTRDALNAQVNEEIDMNKVEDGTYIGNADGGMVKVEVEVTVLNHKITNIELLKHKNGKGKAAEAIIDDMIANNTDDVDAISGATTSSKTIRNAVNKALQKGLK